jgi:hypothetical protein
MKTRNLNDFYKVKTGPIPATVSRGRNSTWRSVLTNMPVGSWMLIPDKNRAGAADAANRYIKGEYSLLRCKDQRAYVLIRK